MKAPDKFSSVITQPKLQAISHFICHFRDQKTCGQRILLSADLRTNEEKKLNAWVILPFYLFLQCSACYEPKSDTVVIASNSLHMAPPDSIQLSGFRACTCSCKFGPDLQSAVHLVPINKVSQGAVLRHAKPLITAPSGSVAAASCPPGN